MSAVPTSNNIFAIGKVATFKLKQNVLNYVIKLYCKISCGVQWRKKKDLKLALFTDTH